jgi:hypothetical protein
MQKLLFFCFLLAGFTTASAQNVAIPADTTTVEFKELEVPFGPIKQGEKFEHDFFFTNTGKTAMKIASAQGSCGCTVPEYPKEPVAPGATGKIHVTFNSAGKMGDQYKTITINANTRPNPIRLAVKGKVEPAETTAATPDTKVTAPKVEQAKAQPMPATPMLKFPTAEQNVGAVAPNTDLSVKFSNAGAQPLKVTKVKGSKNLKVVSFTKDEIGTGSSGVVTYRFKSKAKGAQDATLNITTNGTPAAVSLPIKAVVSVPAKAVTK